MLTGALLILAPLFLGFAIALESRRAMTIIHYTVEGLVYFILLLLGLGLGQMEGLAAQLGGMAAQVMALVLVLFVANMMGLWLFHRWQPMSVERVEGNVSPGYRRLFLVGLKPLVAVIAGLLAGYYLLPDMPMAEQLATWALMFLPLLIAPRPAMAIGYGGATAMDFTLPVIRSSGGLPCVPVAIASGFLLSFLSPVLMGVFLSLG